MVFRYEKPHLVVLSGPSKQGDPPSADLIAHGALNSCNTGSLKTGFHCSTVGQIPSGSTCTVGTYPGGRQCDVGGTASTVCTTGTGAAM
jgi:hypothetical protein